jgi:chromosome segregation ATPase
MSDETKNKPPLYSVRTNDEVMSDVSVLVERTGLSQKDLFSAMVTQFKTNLLSSSDTEQTEDMQQLKYHLSHAESIFANMVQKVHDLKENFTESIDQEKRVHQGIVDQIERSRLQVEAERDKARLDLAEIQDQLKELVERNNELESVNKSNRITIDLLTSQNETLDARIGTVIEMETEVQQLRTQQVDNQRQMERLQTEVVQSVSILELTKERLASAEKESEKSIAAAQKLADLQIHAAGVEASNRVLEATTKLKDEYVVKIDALHEKIQTLTERVHELELGKTKRS